MDHADGEATPSRANRIDHAANITHIPLHDLVQHELSGATTEMQRQRSNVALRRWSEQILAVTDEDQASTQTPATSSGYCSRDDPSSISSAQESTNQEHGLGRGHELGHELGCGSNDSLDYDKKSLEEFERHPTASRQERTTNPRTSSCESRSSSSSSSQNSHSNTQKEDEGAARTTAAAAATRGATGSAATVTVATAVSLGDIETQVRQEILDTAVAATAVSAMQRDGSSKQMDDAKDPPVSESFPSERNYRRCYIILFVFTSCVFLIIGVVLGAVIATRSPARSDQRFVDSPDESNDESNDNDHGSNRTDSRDGSRSDSDEGDGPDDGDVQMQPVNDTDADLVNEVPFPQLEQDLFDFLRASSPDPNALLDPESPAYRAYQWLIPATEAQDLEPEYSHRVLHPFAMVTFYYATNGDEWDINDNWLDYGTPLCRWWTSISPSIRCGQSATLTNIANLSLMNNNLNGYIPAELALLEDLRVLNLDGNNLGQHKDFVQVPYSQQLQPTSIRALRGLRKLEILHLSNANLGGILPPELSRIETLQIIRLRNNQLVGQIPATYRQFQHLKTLDLSQNQLASALPDGLGDLPSIEVVDLHGNQLNGTIPESYAAWNNTLQSFVAYGNGLTGSADAMCRSLTSDDASLTDILVLDCKVDCACCASCS